MYWSAMAKLDGPGAWDLLGGKYHYNSQISVTYSETYLSKEDGWTNIGGNEEDTRPHQLKSKSNVVVVDEEIVVSRSRCRPRWTRAEY